MCQDKCRRVVLAATHARATSFVPDKSGRLFRVRGTGGRATHGCWLNCRSHLQVPPMGVWCLPYRDPSLASSCPEPNVERISPSAGSMAELANWEGADSHEYASRRRRSLIRPEDIWRHLRVISSSSILQLTRPLIPYRGRGNRSGPASVDDPGARGPSHFICMPDLEGPGRRCLHRLCTEHT